MPESHQHIRADDQVGKIVIPAWVKQVVIMVVSIIVATVGVIAWLNTNFTSAKDTQVLNITLNQKMDAIVQTQNDMKDDLKDIKQAMYKRAR